MVEFLVADLRRANASVLSVVYQAAAYTANHPVPGVHPFCQFRVVLEILNSAAAESVRDIYRDRPSSLRVEANDLLDRAATVQATVVPSSSVIDPMSGSLQTVTYGTVTIALTAPGSDAQG